MPDVSLFAAFGAGFLSFISPCVLPLIPGYISYISGMSLDEMRTADASARRRLMTATLAFILGFSLVFMAMGASASAIGALLLEHRRAVSKVAGAVLVIFGLHLAGLFRIKWLDKDTRMQTSRKPATPLGALVVGTAFAFGWTPCIGPILSAILTIAGSKSTVGEGVLLLAVYSAGLGVPFFLTSLAIDRFFTASGRIRRYYRAIELTAGVMMIILGVLIFTGRFTIITRILQPYLPVY
ncbi:MAG: cytochrome c biogenesis protein CcdA [Acidobacteriota bacterium]|nr:cytochrome c biogenesis protein CcdA [Acidobacteriota bacterium]